MDIDRSHFIKLVLSSLILVFILTPKLFSQEYLIKFATLAPEGSTWMNVMKEYDQAIRKESGGRIGFKIYPQGVQGDEKDVLRKIKLGQLHSAGNRQRDHGNREEGEDTRLTISLPDV